MTRGYMAQDRPSSCSRWTLLRALTIDLNFVNRLNITGNPALLRGTLYPSSLLLLPLAPPKLYA